MEADEAEHRRGGEFNGQLVKKVVRGAIRIKCVFEPTGARSRTVKQKLSVQRLLVLLFHCFFSFGFVLGRFWNYLNSISYLHFSALKMTSAADSCHRERLWGVCVL